ncbi:class I adenylate-forming enzyme family protein [Marinobacter lacisalsi]|uniref:Class I adenylate-forming enzyme family protein n=1 Tax=Marinobacter lacisalsi TaxID=475979 RepID=A0ABV8QN25_9GAMM
MTPNSKPMASTSLTSPMSRDEAINHVVNTDPRFAIAQTTLWGTPFTVFANAPDNLRTLLQEAAGNYPDRELLVYGEQRWSASQFASEVNRTAHMLVSELSVQPGDRVALAMRNYPEMPVLLMAIVSVGAVVVPLNAWWSGEELAFAISDSDVHLVFADGDRYLALCPHIDERSVTLVGVRDANSPLQYAELLSRSLDDSWPDVSIAPDDDFAVMYSSGSSGRPKGVLLTHRGAISSVHSWRMGKEVAALMDPQAAADQAEVPAFLVVTPLFHVTALHSVFLQGLALGAKLVLMYKWNAEEAAGIIQREQITRFVGVPTQSAELIQAAEKLEYSLDSLETIGAGGAKRPATQVLQLASQFPKASIATGWGMTETNSLGILLSGPEYVDNPDAAGRLTPPLQEMRIVDATGNQVSTGEVGELTVRSPANMRGYLNLPEETRDTLKDGWLYTGDLARVEESGLIYIVDRKKSIIIRGGENISCLEVEGALHQHPAIAEACVFPVPDERLGETVGAAVYLHEDSHADQTDISAFLKQRLAAFKVPDRIWFWHDPLPRGGTDKLDRKTLQRLCQNLDEE